MQEEINIAIADDHKIFRKGIVLSMRQYTNLHFVLEASNGEELLKQIPETKPDIILCDLRMPIMDGIEATKEITRLYSDIRVIVLTMYDDERYVGHLMDNGAAGYLLKNSEPSEVYKAITDVRKNGFYLSPFVNKILIKKNYSKQPFNTSLKQEKIISIREKEVLMLMAMEHTATEIAAQLYISNRTVEAIKERLIERFELKNSVGLIYYAVKNGLLD
jgi:DNA-binding NarL/FixJ family response regulator